ncbi:MAG TPA: alpha/beta hydrolase, partial [Methanobacterium subterraneum]|nr:alpha/beta hydrolase [Methanobacterium subterraneum]
LKDVNDWIDYEMLENFKKSYLKGQNPSNPLASPIYGNLEGIPPLLMQCGSRELLLCDVNRLRDLAIEKDVKVNLEVWQGMFHSWQLFYSHLPESEGSLRSIGDFVKGLSFE